MFSSQSQGVSFAFEFLRSGIPTHWPLSQQGIHPPQIRALSQLTKKIKGEERMGGIGG